MRQKNTNFRFNKKSLKTFKISDDKNKKPNDDYYSKIISNFFESDKTKEESKNNNTNNKIKKINKIKLSSNSSNRILKITLNANNKFLKKNNIDLSNNIGPIIKKRKTENLNKKQVTKKMIQSISEKNIYKDNKKYEKNDKNMSKSKTNIKNLMDIKPSTANLFINDILLTGTCPL